MAAPANHDNLQNKMSSLIAAAIEIMRDKLRNLVQNGPRMSHPDAGLVEAKCLENRNFRELLSENGDRNESKNEPE